MESISGAGSSLLEKLGLQQQEQKKKEELGQADFLKLLVTQMSHQNPMEPQSNGEFLAQMAQFGTVDGIKELQNSFTSLSSSLQSSKALQASALVGRSVQIASPNAELSAGGTIKGSLELAASTRDIALGIYNTQGELVKTMSLGTRSTGEVAFEWDGVSSEGNAAPAGTYQIKALGFQGDETASLMVNTRHNVDSVIINKDGQGLKLNVAGIGVIPFEEVKEIN